jgi:hypothetical protein
VRYVSLQRRVVAHTIRHSMLVLVDLTRRCFMELHPRFCKALGVKYTVAKNGDRRSAIESGLV